ncbi:MAG: acetyl-CoA carboxylase biotin carboxyl carrier protein, partial [Ignavibacteriales bacterium]|nr:acetyl-CoA carboxylase biotin carboxyl carrier protein [Ignavibacteriales bacterium]
MDLKYVKQLLELLEKSAVNEIEVEEKGHKIRITKSAPHVGGMPMYMPPVQHQVMMPAPNAGAVAAQPGAENKPAVAD